MTVASIDNSKKVGHGKSLTCFLTGVFGRIGTAFVNHADTQYQFLFADQNIASLEEHNEL
ncbi:hypothetical protein [Paenochrobactrum sp. BZR 201-1]|uniref:hypothetical protein n=1 Tax=Paenochrobactrum sp. BZR 201-1 TaxID=3378075 RepID=UPI0038527EBA